MRLTFLVHARRQMDLRGILVEEVRATLEKPDVVYEGARGRIVAKHRLPGRKLVVKVVYNEGAGGERVIVTVMRGRPYRKAGDSDEI